jgi:hypothetical protein
MRALFDEGLTLDAAARIVGLQDNLATAQDELATAHDNLAAAKAKIAELEDSSSSRRRNARIQTRSASE